MSEGQTSATRHPEASLPLGRKVPRGRLRWYFVACTEGEEARTCRKARRIVPSDLLQDAFVPLAECAIKRQGSWGTRLCSVFDGYFVAATTDAPELAQQLARLTFPAHMAGAVGRGFAPMDEDAERFLAAHMDDMHVVRMSEGEVTHGELHVLSGPLVGCEERIRHIDRNERLAQVRVGSTAAGEGFALTLPLSVTVKQTREYKDGEVDNHPQIKLNDTSDLAAALAAIPLDERALAGQPRWYLATCMPKHEEEACEALRASAKDFVQEAFVPYMEEERKVRGEWRIRTVPLIRGLFVVVTANTIRLSARMDRMGIGITLVGATRGWPAPVAQEAQVFLERIMDDTHTVRMSWSEIVNDELCVGKGPLVGLEGRVALYNRRRCYAMVRMCEASDKYLLKLPLAITARR